MAERFTVVKSSEAEVASKSYGATVADPEHVDYGKSRPGDAAAAAPDDDDDDDAAPATGSGSGSASGSGSPPTQPKGTRPLSFPSFAPILSPPPASQPLN